MTDVVVDNTSVTVLLRDNETYTPAMGSVQKVTVVVPSAESLEISDGGSAQQLVRDSGGSGEPNAHTTEMVVDDGITLVGGASSSADAVYVSGFEVN